ncbi:MAG: hypothetical protein JWN03_7411 [Nocardia sp.]|uniref:hypothetical protein n=1 Tax=Nocardia sp. TaxID=1821 RepID=UPI0026077898|nr:hypothetical protein [Nocardia sp.]MCU1647136.1 hypothetical protein [Nocardia sp.]
MKRRAQIVVLAATAAAAATAALAGCSSDDDSKGTPASRPAGTTKAAATATGFPEPPPFTYEVQGKEIRVATGSADPTDLVNTYNKVARTLQSSLSEGGYWVRINCTSGGTGKADNRLANGTLAVGQLGKAQIGGLGKFAGVLAGAHCP